MKLKIFIAFFVIVPWIAENIVLANQGDYKPYTFPTKVPAQYKIDAESRYQKLMDDLGERFPDKDDGQLSRYAEKQVYGLKDIIESGKIYMGWTELEEYLDAIVTRLLPPEIKKEEIKVYASTGTDVNAFAFHDGTILINIGLLAEAESEAELAFILGHELSHYFYNDVRKQYFNSLEAKKKKNREDEEFLRRSALEQAAYSRSVEKRADSFAFHMVENAGYRIRPGILSLYKMLSEQKQFEDMRGSGKTIKTVMVSEEEGDKEQQTIDQYLFSSHPELGERTALLREMKRQTKKAGEKANFLVSEKKFYSLRTKARYEKVHLLLKRDEIRTGIEKSFAYHIQSPKKSYFQTHLLHGVRRALYLYPGLQEKGFLTNIYDQDPFTSDTVGILKDLHYLLPDSISYNKIRASHFLDDDYEFNTYGEAFDYFSQKCLDKGLKEAYLSMALHFRDEKATKEKLLKKYLSEENIQHRAYAKALMNNNIDGTLSGSRDIVLLNQFKFIEDHTYGYHRRFLRESREKGSYISKAKEHVKANNPEKNFISAEELKNKNYSKLINTLNIFNTVMTFEERLEEKDEEKQPETYYMDEEAKKSDQHQKPSARKLFYYKPEIWEHFKEQEISSMGYLSVVAFDDKTDIVGYLNFINPLFYLRLFTEFFNGFTSGPERFHFSMFYYKFSPEKKEKIQSHVEDVGYKMTENNFINALYYTLNSEKNQDK